MTFDSRKATTLVMILLFGGACLLALNLPAKASFMPLLVGIPGLILCLWQLGVDIRAELREAPAAGEEKKKPEDEGGTSEARMLFWLGLFTAALVGFGFLVGGTVMVILFIRFAMRDTWQDALFAGGGTFATLYGVFIWLLELKLFEGLVLRAILH